MSFQIISDEELQQAKQDYERTTGVQHHKSQETKCHCGRSAAQPPALADWVFRSAKAKVQQAAADAQKCVECFKIDQEIDQYLAACKRSTQ
jgi:hypothetical protein